MTDARTAKSISFDIASQLTQFAPMWIVIASRAGQVIIREILTWFWRHFLRFQCVQRPYPCNDKLFFLSLSCVIVKLQSPEIT